MEYVYIVEEKALFGKNEVAYLNLMGMDGWVLVAVVITGTYLKKYYWMSEITKSNEP